MSSYAQSIFIYGVGQINQYICDGFNIIPGLKIFLPCKGICYESFNRTLYALWISGQILSYINIRKSVYSATNQMSTAETEQPIRS